MTRLVGGTAQILRTQLLAIFERHNDRVQDLLVEVRRVREELLDELEEVPVDGGAAPRFARRTLQDAETQGVRRVDPSREHVERPSPGIGHHHLLARKDVFEYEGLAIAPSKAGST